MQQYYCTGSLQQDSQFVLSCTGAGVEVGITSSGGTWQFMPLTGGYHVDAGVAYIVAMTVNEGTSMTRGLDTDGLPKTFGDITINASGFAAYRARKPFYFYTTKMHGEVDIEFVPD